MRIFLMLLCGMIFCDTALAGTLIYKNKEGAQKLVSDLTIVSIDQKKMVVRINNGTETLALSQVVKYYDTDIRISGDFDDSTGEYSVSLGTESFSAAKKKNGRLEFSIPYSINKAKGVSLSTPVRQPYFYLFVLVHDSETSDRKMMTFCYPAKAKAGMRNYDEAKMLEKAISLDRPTRYNDSFSIRRASRKRLGGERDAVFQLNKIDKNAILAWYLVVWGKDSIVAVKEWKSSSAGIGRNWWVR